MGISVIEQNKKLIDRYVSLATGQDNIIDGTHKWFYSIFSQTKLEQINLEEDDIRQDIIIHILELNQKYRGPNFNLILNQLIAWFVRDKLLFHLKQMEAIKDNSYLIDNTYCYDYELNLNWAVSNGRLLTQYEQFLLYLNIHKCYSVNEIAKITFQDRKSVRLNLQTAKEVLIKELQ